MVDDNDGRVIHVGVDPFATPVDQRDPTRRFRGRLASPVTVWTASDDDGEPAGITVSSMLVAEGDDPTVVGLIDPLSAFWSAVESTGRFMVHVLDRDRRRLADQLAGRYPGPDARFENVELRPSEWGPVIADVETRAACSLNRFDELGDALLVQGLVAEFTIGEISRPLVYFRGRYVDAVAREPGSGRGSS